MKSFHRSNLLLTSHIDHASPQPTHHLGEREREREREREERRDTERGRQGDRKSKEETMESEVVGINIQIRAIYRWRFSIGEGKAIKSAITEIWNWVHCPRLTTLVTKRPRDRERETERD